jgi:hypothetical protein
MFANSRTESEMIRMNCEMTSMKKIGPAAKPLTPAGSQPLRWPRTPCRRTPST